MSTDDPLNAYGVHFYQGIADDVAAMQELAARALEFVTRPAGCVARLSARRVGSVHAQ